MVETNERRIYGSVIQRSLIPQNLGGILNIATVPIDEIDRSYLESDSQDKFRRLVSQITGVPVESMIDERQYQQLTKRFLDRHLLEDFLHATRWNFFYYDEFILELKKIDLPENSSMLLASHALSLMASPITGSYWVSPFTPFLSKRVKRHYEIAMENEALELGFKCFLSALLPDERVRSFVHSALSYDIPSGQSPETDSDSLLNLFENSKKVCLAPMGAGGVASIPLLTKGSYVAALLCAGTGAAITLILIGTVSVADYLVYYLLHKRNAIDKVG